MKNKIINSNRKNIVKILQFIQWKNSLNPKGLLKSCIKKQIINKAPASVKTARTENDNWALFTYSK